MRSAWPVAAFVAGSLAAPSNNIENAELIHRRQDWSADSGQTYALTTSTSPSSSASTADATSINSQSEVFTGTVPIFPAPAEPTYAWFEYSAKNSTIRNDQQVGNSTWGTPAQPYLPQWLGDYEEAPWNNCTVSTCDATVKSQIPMTNVTRYYEFNVSRGRISTDGVLRDVILINEQFPGPALEANWGDWFQITVNNNITGPEEGTSMHWHGQVQRSTPWEDGVPGAAQCPIAPGASFTYLFQAELYGTSWYHSHYSAQFSAGLAGPMVVHGPSSLPYDIDVGPVMLSDWYHIPYFAIVSDAVGTNLSLIPPTSDSNLINGRGRYDCSDSSYNANNQLLASNIESNITYQCVDDVPLSSFRFQSGKTHRLRLINHGANGVQRFSIDNHQMTVIAYDFVPIVPYNLSVVTLGVGQRADVLVTALDTPEAAIWMRSSASGGEACGGSDHPEVLAAIYYEDADYSCAPTSSPSSAFIAANTTTTSPSCVNDALSLTTPAYSITPSKDYWTQDLVLELALNATGHFEFQINGQRYHADYNIPLLSQAAAGNLSFEPQWNVYNFEQNTSIILNLTNEMPLVHPFHMHGHNFYILDVGGPEDYAPTASGGSNGPLFSSAQTWNGSVQNPTNPMRRDGLLVPPYGYAAIQFELDNPGIWPFHCHIAWHLSGGQGMNILYDAQSIPTLPTGFTGETCDYWVAWTSQNRVDQIDSGA